MFYLIQLIILFRLYPAYRISEGQPIISEEYGSWDTTVGLLDIRKTRIVSNRRRNLHGHQLVAASVFMNSDSVNHVDLDDYK